MDNKAFEFRMKPRKEKNVTDEVTVINPSDVTVLPKDKAHMSTSTGSLPVGGNAMGNIPAFAVMEIVNTALGLVDTAIKTNGEVRLAKEQTKQVRAQAETYMVQAKEQTKQVRVQETETTKRFKMQMDNELRMAELKLKEEKERLDYQLMERKLSHIENMKSLENLEILIRSNSPDQAELTEQLKNAKMSGEVVDSSLPQKVIDQNREFVKLAEQIRRLRQ